MQMTVSGITAVPFILSALSTCKMVCSALRPPDGSTRLQVAKISSVAELCLLANGVLAGQKIDLQGRTLTHLPQPGTEFCKKLIFQGQGTTLCNGTLKLAAGTQITLRAPKMTLHGITINGAFSFTKPCGKGSVVCRWESFCTRSCASIIFNLFRSGNCQVYFGCQVCCLLNKSRVVILHVRLKYHERFVCCRPWHVTTLFVVYTFRCFACCADGVFPHPIACLEHISHDSKRQAGKDRSCVRSYIVYIPYCH